VVLNFAWGSVVGKRPNFKKKTQPTTVSILAVGFAAKQHLQTVPEHDCTVLDRAIERSVERERKIQECEMQAQKPQRKHHVPSF